LDERIKKFNKLLGIDDCRRHDADSRISIDLYDVCRKTSVFGPGGCQDAIKVNYGKFCDLL